MNDPTELTPYTDITSQGLQAKLLEKKEDGKKNLIPKSP